MINQSMNQLNNMRKSEKYQKEFSYLIIGFCLFGKKL